MDDFSWIILGGLVALALPVMAIGGFFMSVGLKGRMRLVEMRVETLQREIASLRAAPGGPATDLRTAPPSTPKIEPEPEPVVAPKPAPAAADDGEWEADGGPAPPTEDEPSPAPAPRPRAGIEEALGARWAVWVGGLALALGGVFLVRYSFEAGLIGPGMRIVLGLVFALGLILAGEVMRRRDPQAPASPGRSVYIPGVVTAAGTASLFASIYAAHAIYGFIGPAAAFLALGAVGVATMFAAALHGPWLAGLGLIGAYATPVLVSSSAPSPWALSIYLVVVTAAAFGLARLRLWRWLALAATLASLIWGVLIVGIAGVDAPAAAAYVLALAGLVAAILVVEPHRGRRDFRGFDVVGLLAMAGTGALALLFAVEADVSHLGLAVALVAAGAMLAVALVFEGVAPAAGLAALVGLGLLALWPIGAQVDAAPITVGPGGMAFPPVTPAAVELYLTIALVVAAALLLATTMRLGRGEIALRPAVALALAGTAGPVLVLACSYLRATSFSQSIPFAATALGLAALHAAIAHRFMAREDNTSGAVASLHAAAATAALALALTMILEGSSLTLAFALASLGVTWVAAQRPLLPALRWCAAGLTILVLCRIGGSWTIFGEALTTFPSWSDIVQRYAVPAVLLAVAGRLLRRQAIDTPAAILDGASIVLGATAAALAVRLWIVGPADALTKEVELIEGGLYVTLAFAAAIAFARGALRTTSVIHRLAAPLATAIAVAAAVLGPILFLNPAAAGEDVEGGILVNSLVLGYLAPAALAALASVLWRRLGESSGEEASFARAFAAPLAGASGIVALVLAFLYVTLETRVVVSGPDMSFGNIPAAESYAYSVVWLLFGIILLAGGLVAASRGLRLASALVILLTVAKVFLLDMSELEGAWRALSFIGLGIVLIGIGLVYQRLLSRGASRAPARGT